MENGARITTQTHIFPIRELETDLLAKGLKSAAFIIARVTHMKIWPKGQGVRPVASRSLVVRTSDSIIA